MATANSTDQQAPTPKLPPAVGRPISVRVRDKGMYDDLRVIMQTGCDVSTAVRQAVLYLANVYHGAWAAGVYPPGVPPVILTTNVAPYKPVRRTDQDV